MCFCCCETRKSILIYLIVISSLAFIYGIISLSKFGSNTDLYKLLKVKLEILEGSSSNYNYNNYNNNYNYNYRKLASYTYNPYYNDYDYDYNYAKEVLDSDSTTKIASLTNKDIQDKSYGMVKNLKGIEKGLGVILFVFIIIFLAVEIFYIVFTCENHETQVCKNNIFTILNISKIISLTYNIYLFISII